MSEPPATPDELAATYLRARDVPCPGCGYNRRDGATAACPECGRFIRIAPEGSGVDERTGRIASVVSVIIACGAALACGAAAMIIAQYRPDTSDLVATTLLFATVCTAIVAMNRAVCARLPDGQRYLRQFIATLGIAALLYAAGMLILLWEDLF